MSVSPCGRPGTRFPSPMKQCERETPVTPEDITNGPCCSGTWNIRHSTEFTFTRSGRAGYYLPFAAIPVFNQRLIITDASGPNVVW